MTIRSRDVRKYAQKGHHRFASVAEFTASSVKEGVSSILLNNRWLDLRFDDNGSETTLVYFHAALPAKIPTYPFLGGVGIFQDIRVNYLYLSDPLIGAWESLPTGWFAGSRRIQSQKILPRIIRHVARPSEGRRLVFFGASEGGFAALHYSARFPGSRVVVVNPVTDIESRPTFPQYAEAAWPRVDTAGIRRRITTSVVRQYQENPQNTVVYLQNRQDPTYLEGQLRPFLEANSGREGIYLATGDWGHGHVTPPKQVILRTVDALIRDEPELETVLDPDRYVKAPTPVAIDRPWLTPEDERPDRRPVLPSGTRDGSEEAPGDGALKSIFMYGGCVTRDSFEGLKGEYRLAKYVARQSLISSGHPPVAIDAAQSALPSKFQTEQLRGDIESSLFPALRGRAASVDAIVLDLVVERLGVRRFGDGYLTQSNELALSPAHTLLTSGHEAVRFGSRRHFKLWSQCSERLRDLLQQLGALDRTVVFDTPWASCTQSGVEVPGFRNVPNQTMNERYVPYFARLRELGIRVERLPDELVVADDNHRWGMAPYHYVPETYAWMADVVRSIPSVAP